MDISNLTDDECQAHGLKLGKKLSIHQQVKLLEGIRAGHQELRAEQHVAGQAIVGPDLHLSRMIEMLGYMDIEDIRASSVRKKVTDQQMNA